MFCFSQDEEEHVEFVMFDQNPMLKYWMKTMFDLRLSFIADRFSMKE